MKELFDGRHEVTIKRFAEVEKSHSHEVESHEYMRKLYIDFEFCEVSEPQVTLVCCETWDDDLRLGRHFWLHNAPEQTLNGLRNHLKDYDLIVCYAAVAECRAFLALGLDVREWNWLDLFLEYRMICNHNDKMLTGNQLVNGKVKHFKKLPPKWERVEGESGFKPTHSLAEATYKLTGEIRDTAHKNQMRDLIISNPTTFTPAERRAIQDYCFEDVRLLPRLQYEIEAEYMRLTKGES